MLDDDDTSDRILIPFHQSIDLHLTLDGEIIVLHDPTLERTTNGTGLAKNRPWHGYIDGLKSKKEPHVGVPRCLDVLAFLAQEGNEKVWWNIDIKVRPCFFFFFLFFRHTQLTSV